MANVTTVSRPYAKAILALAAIEKNYDAWSLMLQLLAGIIADPMGNKIVSNLAISSREKAQFIIDVAGDKLSAQAKNLIKVLARSKRLLILPELYRLYEVMRKSAENLIEVDFTLAKEIAANDFNNIETICKEHLPGNLTFSETINAELIGGGVATIGNRVIDGSIMGRLQALHNLLRK